MAATYDMAVIGGGPGGYSAALYAVRAGLRVVVLEKLCPGGQMALTDQIENYPGFDQGVDGFALGEAMRRGAERFGAETVLAEVPRERCPGSWAFPGRRRLPPKGFITAPPVTECFIKERT